MKTISILLLALFAFACTERTEFHIEASLQPYYDAFMQEASKRSAPLDDVGNLIMIVRPNALKDYGGLAVTRKIPGGQHYIYVDFDYFNTHTPEQLKIIVYHELGHCYLNRSHNTNYSIMNPKISALGIPECNSNPQICANKYAWLITELFYNSGK